MTPAPPRVTRVSREAGSWERSPGGGWGGVLGPLSPLEKHRSLSFQKRYCRSTITSAFENDEDVLTGGPVSGRLSPACFPAGWAPGAA